MSKIKLNEEELKGLQEAIQKVNNFQMQIGGLETQKHQILSMILEANAALQTIQKELEETYGKVQVDVTTGEITESDEEHSQED
tara:strand:+ start:939 stop:1190 length:252 start_codon:yes stop_codon:yes gene_type:complete